MKRYLFGLLIGIASYAEFPCSEDKDTKEDGVKKDSVTTKTYAEQTKRRRDTVGDEQVLKTRIDSIVVFKNLRRMEVYSNGRRIKSYIISLGRNPVGDKQFEGDYKTPEGLYYINGRNPNSIFHKNLGISYPDENDRKYARQMKRNPGGDIKIHGLPNGRESGKDYYLNNDWTYGCISVSNEEIDELYDWVRIGARVLIRR